MEVWIAVTVLGGILSLAGLAALVRRYQQGLVSGLELTAVLITYTLLVGGLLLTEVFETRPAGTLFVLIMLPLWSIIAFRARRRRQR